MENDVGSRPLRLPAMSLGEDGEGEVSVMFQRNVPTPATFLGTMERPKKMNIVRRSAMALLDVE